MYLGNMKSKDSRRTTGVSGVRLRFRSLRHRRYGQEVSNSPAGRRVLVGSSVATTLPGSDTIKVAETNVFPGTGGRDNSSATEAERDPEMPSLAGTNTLGDGGAENNLIDLDRASTVKVDSILAEYAKNDAQHYKANSRSIKVYSRTFRRFDEAVNLERFSKQALVGKKGKELLLEFLLGHIPATGTRQITNAHLKRVWTKGLGLAYPVTRDDLGKLRPMGENPVPCPGAQDVKPVVEALDKEPDAYTKSLIACLVEFGFRPEQLRKLKWRNLVTNSADSKRFCGFVAKGSIEGFKRDSPLIAYIPDYVADALMAWHDETQNTKPESLIWPGRSKGGKIEYGKQLGEKSVKTIFDGFLAKYHIKSGLVPYSFRHFATDLAEKRLSNKLSEIRQGRILEGYGRNKNPMDFLDEMKNSWPEGVIGSLTAPKVDWVDDTEERLVAQWRRLKQGNIKWSEFRDLVEDLAIQPSETPRLEIQP